MNIALAEEVVFTYLLLRLPIVFLFSIITLSIQVLRSRLFGYRFYRPFLLNIFLAWIPFVLSIFAQGSFLRNGYSFTSWTWAFLLIWFLFFPNAVYLITEVHHFRDKTDVPLWFDTIALLSIVFNGILLGVYSLMIIHLLLRSHFNYGMSWIILIGYVLLANLGIYIGRYLRFNSWDIVRRPHRLISQTIAQINTWRKLGAMALYISLFAFLILTFYVFIELDFLSFYSLAQALNKARGQ